MTWDEAHNSIGEYVWDKVEWRPRKITHMTAEFAGFGKRHRKPHNLRPMSDIYDGFVRTVIALGSDAPAAASVACDLLLEAGLCSERATSLRYLTKMPGGGQ